jgi:signal transduction histidine kinase
MQVGRQAIANALQHAHASNIHVLLSYGERFLQIQVQDNGRGIDEEALNSPRPGHYGMAGMKERAERLGGSLSVRSVAGEGTEVNLSVPVHIVYQDDVSASGSRLAHKMRYLLGRLRVRDSKWNTGSPSQAQQAHSQSGKPHETQS